MSAKILSAEDIIGSGPEYEYDTVETKKGTFRIGSVDADAFITWAEENQDPAKKRLASIRLINLSLVDEEGNRIGSDRMVEALKKKSPSIIRQLTDAVVKLNGLDDEKAKESVKNGSGEATTAASPTA